MQGSKQAPAHTMSNYYLQESPSTYENQRKCRVGCHILPSKIVELSSSSSSFPRPQISPVILRPRCLTGGIGKPCVGSGLEPGPACALGGSMGRPPACALGGGMGKPPAYTQEALWLLPAASAALSVVCAVERLTGRASSAAERRGYDVSAAVSIC